jgi:hypothetical protein
MILSKLSAEGIPAELEELGAFKESASLSLDTVPTS